MSKNIFIIKFLVLFSIILIYSCNKNQNLDNLSQIEQLTSEARNTTATAYEGISVVNGLFIAETNNDLKEFLHYLERSESDQDLSNALYSSIGLDQTTRSSLGYYTDHPGSYKFEEDFAFRSIRKIEEEAIFEKLDKGEDVFQLYLAHI